jgi:acyl homoserine lactone synthase
MIRILTNADKTAFPDIFESMFRARAAIFRDRLQWDVRVHEGMEFDRYDESEDPVYVVALDSQAMPVGSLRLLPTTGDTMLRNEFAAFFTEPVDVVSPTAWECTRFCVHPTPDGHGNLRRVSSELLIGLCELALTSGIEHIVGLYDHAMTRIYRRIGWSPAPLATSRPEVGKLVVGLWNVSEAALHAMRQAIGLHSTAGPTKLVA